MELVEIAAHYGTISKRSADGEEPEQRKKRSAALTGAAMLGGAAVGNIAGKRAGFAAIGRAGRERIGAAHNRYIDAVGEAFGPDGDTAQATRKLLAAGQDMKRSVAVPRNAGRAGFLLGGAGGYAATGRRDKSPKNAEE